VDATTPLSRVLAASRLPRGDAIRTMCDLVERHILVLRAPK
jgi:hypothetical protein